MEKRIYSLLKETGDSYLAADALAKQWQQGILETNEVEQVAYFFLNCGFLPTLLSNGVYALERGRPVPWTALALAIHQGVTDNPFERDRFLKALLKGAKEKGQVDKICSIKELHHLDKELSKQWTKKVQQQLSDYLQEKKLLKEDLDIARSQQLLGQEKQIIEKWKKLFPRDEDVKQEETLYKERWARKVLEEKAHSAQWKKIQKQAENQQSFPEDLSDKLLTQVKDSLNKEDDLDSLFVKTTDFAIMLQQMELPQLALEILNSLPEGEEEITSEKRPSYDWLLLELYLECHREVDALSHLERVEKKYADEPDALFAVNYGRARAMIGIGQEEKAIPLLKSIVKLRPHYRNAQQLLSQMLRF